MAALQNWYAFACEVARTPDRVLKVTTRMTRSERCSLRAIARLHPEIGRVLDELAVPLRICRTIAHGRGAAEQWERAEQLIAEMIERRAKESPRRARFDAELFASLRDAMFATSGKT